MARRSTGLQFAIHFRASHTDYAHFARQSATKMFLPTSLNPDDFAIKMMEK
jgi:hypothetical protein